MEAIFFGFKTFIPFFIFINELLRVLYINKLYCFSIEAIEIEFIVFELIIHIIFFIIEKEIDITKNILF